MKAPMSSDMKLTKDEECESIDSRSIDACRRREDCQYYRVRGQQSQDCKSTKTINDHRPTTTDSQDPLLEANHRDEGC
ncbi:hypothetical protein Tco_0774016 [Tanacetum coccineum]|uniref:Uncharacterized protein n=1 Tax=Tanacetum coccineum TaxID=301880 RepID=A0ABQ4ZMD8_9ASTR